jgi:hypothetical protein
MVKHGLNSINANKKKSPNPYVLQMENNINFRNSATEFNSARYELILYFQPGYFLQYSCIFKESEKFVDMRVELKYNLNSNTMRQSIFLNSFNGLKYRSRKT